MIFRIILLIVFFFSGTVLPASGAAAFTANEKESVLQHPEAKVFTANEKESVLQHPEAKVFTANEKESVLQHSEAKVFTANEKESVLQHPEAKVFTANEKESVLQHPEAAAFTANDNESFLYQAPAKTPETENQTPGNVTGYQIEERDVLFTTDNGYGLKLSILGSSVFRVWIDPEDSFTRKNPSFAVINETIEEVTEINLEETSRGYEIFTGELIIRVNARPLRLSIYNRYQRLLLEDYQDQGFVWQDPVMTSLKTMRNDENFYGLGEKGGPLNRRGRAYRMWNSDRPCYAPDDDPLYKSIPFFMSSYGYGIFFDNTYMTEFSFGTESEEYYSFSSPGGEMIYYFMYGPDYKQIIGHYTKLTGRPIMPPKWAFGFAQSRGLLTNEILTRNISNGFRARNIPADIIYQDIGWTQELQDFSWRVENYNDPRQMIRDLEEDGFKVVVSQNPVISQRNAAQWKEADSLGLFVVDVRTGEPYDMPWPWGGNCGVVDFTLPGVSDWWGNYQQNPIDDGVRGFWTDMGEPAWSNEEDTDRLHMQHHLGMHEEIHNVYGLTWSRVVTEQFEKRNPNTRIFQMTRAGFAGLQRYTFGWSGDTGFEADVLNGWPSLRGQIPMALSAGMGLIPFWSTDISGYCGDMHDYRAFSELYARWMQFGVFNPLSRAHHEGDNAVEPWLFGREVEEISREAIELKYRLFPYTYSYAREAFDTGLPLMRAMILEFPDDQEVADVDQQFMFGNELLVAPVVQQYAYRKQVYLPEGEWIDYSDPAKIYEGGQWIYYPVDLSTIPVFVKKGSIVPEMPVMQYIHEDPEYPVILNVFPASDSRPVTFALYEDDGLTNDYKKDIYLIREIRTAAYADHHDIQIVHHKENRYEPTNRAYEIRLHMEQQPLSVESANGPVSKAGKGHSSQEPGKGHSSEEFGTERDSQEGVDIKNIETEKSRNSLSGNDFSPDSDKSAGDQAEWYWNEEERICVIRLPATGDDHHLKVDF